MKINVQWCIVYTEASQQHIMTLAHDNNKKHLGFKRSQSNTLFYSLYPRGIELGMNKSYMWYLLVQARKLESRIVINDNELYYLVRNKHVQGPTATYQIIKGPIPSI